MPRKKVFLLVGTHKGAFIFSSDENRKKWKLAGPLLKGADVNEIILDARLEPTLYACVNSCGIYVGTSGGQVMYSRNEGDSWNILADWLPAVYSIRCAVV